MTIDRDKFLSEFTESLNTAFDEGPQGKVKNPQNQMKTCLYGLKECCSKYSPLTPDNFAQFKSDYFSKIDQYVENQHQQGKGVYWINGAMAQAAKKAFNTLEKIILAVQARLQNSNNHLPTSSSSSSNSTPRTQFLLAPHASLSKIDINDQTLFTKNDLSYSRYTKEQTATLQFAENCCAYPKLALYLAENHKMNPDDAARNINAYLAKHTALSNASLTPEAILNFMKEMKSGPSKTQFS